MALQRHKTKASCIGLALLAVSIPNVNPCSAQHVVGAASGSACSRWIELRDAAAVGKTFEVNGRQESAFTLYLGMNSWAMGFISGMAATLDAAGDQDVLADVSENVLSREIDAECQNNRQQPLVLALLHVFKRHVKR